MADFLSRSWLFEVVNSITNVIQASFTLVIPPQGVRIKERGRVNITKTFGNAFIDDYGPDNLEITLSGLSGTSHVYPTFRTSGFSSMAIPGVSGSPSIVGYDARGAFYAFRNEIMRYRDLPNFDQLELRVYDLFDQQAYKCVLVEFDLDRDAAQPLFYKYSINLFVFARFDSGQAAKGTQISIAQDPLTALGNLAANIAQLQILAAPFSQIQNMVDGVASVINSVNLLSAKFNTFIAQTANIAQSPLMLVKQVLSAVEGFATIGRNAYEAGLLTATEWSGIAEVVQDSLDNTLGIYGYAITQGSGSSAQETLPEDAGLSFATGSTVKVENDQTYSYTGVILYTVKANDTLQTIALSQLGDETLWPYIAMINGMIGNQELVVNSKIYVPVTADVIPVVPNKDAYILTESASPDPYGTDIQLDGSGNIVVTASNDVSLVSGLDNVIQAVNVRLGTLRGSMIKETTFGLSAQPGQPGVDLATSYLTSNLKAQLLADPRIQSLNNISYTISGDQLIINLDIQVVGYDKTLPIPAVVL